MVMERSDRNSLLKQADKGLGVVVMDRTRYVVEAVRQLSDVGVYVALDKDPTEDMIKKVNNTRISPG